MTENNELRDTLNSGEFSPEEGKTKKKIMIITIILITTVGIIDIFTLLLGNTSSSSESSNKIDMSKWIYNEEDSLYYQLGITYYNKPIDLK